MGGLPLTKKILAKASGKETVESGEFVEAKIDAVMVNDLTGPLAVNAFEKLKNKKIWDKDKIVIILDHQVPADRVHSAELHKKLRKFAVEYGIKNFYDVGRGGICHQVMVEEGFVKPGCFVVGADSHTCTYGALGAFATGIGSTEMAAVFATGKLWFRVPETIQCRFTGEIPPNVMAKDLILHMVGEIGADGATYKAIDFSGDVVKKLSVDGRLTLCNMVVEMGAKSGIIQPDQKTYEYLKDKVFESYNPVFGDPDAKYEKEMFVDVENLEAQVACPPNVSNVRVADDLADVEINQAFLGSCTNGRIEDLRIAAKILRGKKIKENVRMIVVPASQKIYMEALKEGLIEVFVKAGAFFGPPTCGPCLGGHFGLLADDEVCISSTNRNFIGRMGSPKSKVYLASPATVAASALTGKITNPKKFIT